MTRTRSLEVWHIPKRSNIHQIIGAVEILSQDAFNGKSWTTMRQENFNTNLGRYGLTEKGVPLSPSARRTLEALIKYLGFIFIDSQTTPSTINVTMAGFELFKKHGSVLGLEKNLNITSQNQKEIKESFVVRHQMNKLQITNPVIKDDCINILLFPFRITLRLLLNLTFLTKEELGYIVFSMKTEDEYNLVIEKIKTFRLLPNERRIAEIEAFKKTEIGNLTLVQAPTSGYYIGLCVATGLCERKNGNLCISKDKMNEVENILHRYKNIKPFDFGNNLMLWIDYFGDLSKDRPPLLVNISLNLNQKYYLKIYDREDVEVFAGTVTSNIDDCATPLFEGKEYSFHFYNFINAQCFYIVKKLISSNSIVFTIPDVYPIHKVNDSIENIEKQITDLIDSRDYDPEYAHHVSVVAAMTEKINFNPSLLRGGRLEYLFYILLKKYKELGKIDDVIWNGRIDDLGIMYPALGKKEGQPDIYFFIKNNLYILELTTIRGNAEQWSAEGASVHDHIINLKKKIGDQYKVFGIFSAPLIGSRLENMFAHISKNENIPHFTIPITELLSELKKMPDIFNF